MIKELKELDKLVNFSISFLKVHGRNPAIRESVYKMQSSIVSIISDMDMIISDMDMIMKSVERMKDEQKPKI